MQKLWAYGQQPAMYVILVCAIGSLFVLASISGAGSDNSQTTSVKGSAPSIAATPDRSKFMGARACLDCHRSEYVAWLGTEHYKNPINRYEISEVSVAKKYLDQGGKLNRCYSCHSAPAEQNFGRVAVESGTSCESCHGAAGGNSGWLNRHAVYGTNVTTLKQETPEHYRQRIAFCDQAGMIRPGHQYEVAKNCFRCHMIGDPTLVSDEVGHPVIHEKFSLIPYLNSEVQHNFHLNQKANAEAPTLDTLRRGLSSLERKRVYLVLGQLAKIEVALRYLVDFPSDEALEERYAGKLIDAFEEGADEIDYYTELLLEPDDDDVPALEEEQIESLLTVIELFEDFDDLDKQTRDAARETANQIAKIAEEFLKTFGDGKQLAALDVVLEELDDPPSQPLKP